MERVLLLQRVFKNFIKHVEDLRNEDDPAGDGFYREFKILRDLSMKMRDEETYPTLEGKKQHNFGKNRYKDILPFDATRVVLAEIPGELGSDYINANFIKNQCQNVCYIATQGPIQDTVYDFWRMIVLHKVKVITMACKLVEMGKKKCEQYWPSEVNEMVEYKDISVRLLAEEVMIEHCTKRFLKVSKDGNIFMVTQFHYTGWPDHDIPNDFNVIFKMMAEMREIKAADVDKAPMVIHCSAGCGRTGTICAIDYTWDMLNSWKLTIDFSLFEIVKEMRMQRQSMIQAPEQYKMAHIMVQKLFQMHLDTIEYYIYDNVSIDKQVDKSDQMKGEVSDSIVKQLPQKNSILQNEIERTIKLVMGVPNLHTVSEKYVLSQSQLEQKLEPVMSAPAKDAVTLFKVEKIESIPQTNKIYYTLNNKTDIQNETLNYISSGGGKKDLKVEIAMLDNFDPLLESKNSFGLDSSKHHEYAEPNNVAAITTESSTKSQKSYQQIVSQQEKSSGKFKTIISVGSVVKKQPVQNTTVSTPVETLTNAHGNSASKALSINSNINSSDFRLSSAPKTLLEQSCDRYSSASNSRQYSLLRNTSSVESTHSAHLNPSADAGASLNDHIHTAKSQNPYSVADYSSVQGAIKYTGPLKEFNPYSSVDLDFTTPVDSQRVITSSDQDIAYSVVDVLDDSNGHPDGCYSIVDKPPGSLSKPVARDYKAIAFGDKVTRPPPPQIPERNYEEPSVDKTGDSNGLPDGFYSIVNKPPGSLSKPVASDYEAIAFGDKVTRPPPPQIPERNYEEPSVDKTDSGVSSMLLKQTHSGSMKRTLYSPSKATNGPGTAQPTLHSVVAGFKKKADKKPGGPKPHPVNWDKK